MYQRRHQNQIVKTLKDYAVPIVGGVLILFLVFNFIFGGDNTDDSSNKENTNGLTLVLDSPDTDAYVIYSGDFKKKIEGAENLSLYKGEKVVVNTGNVVVSGDFGEANVNKLGEYKYNTDGSFTLVSSDVWIKTNNNINVSMRYAEVSLGESTVVNMTQNEVASTLYLLQGFAEIKNLAGKNTVLAPGQKITVSRVDAAKTDIDLSLQKEDMDDFFKSSDWYIKNNGSMYLSTPTETTTTDSGSVLTGSTVTLSTTLTFDTISDGQSFSSDTINISGKILKDGVTKIKIGETEATVNKDAKTFTFSNYALSGKVNDIIIRAYDDSGDILSKDAFTLYKEGVATQKSNLFEVTSYSLDSKDFKFIAPKENPYTTTDDVVTIEGTVPARTVAKIVVGDYTLSQFPKFGTYWKYHANAEFGNLNEGLNVYEVKYYGEDGKLIHTNAFSIIKKKEETSTATGEAN